MQGRAFKFGDNISTDHIAPGRLFHLRSDLQEFAKHVLEDADENFAKEMKKVILLLLVTILGLDHQENMPHKSSKLLVLVLLLPSLLQEFFIETLLTLDF